MDYKNLIDGLKGLINEQTAPEQAEQIGSLIAGTQQLEVDHNKTVEAYESMRQKYIEGIKTASISKNVDNPIQDEAQPKTFEQCVQEQIDKRTK